MNKLITELSRDEFKMYSFKNGCELVGEFYRLNQNKLGEFPMIQGKTTPARLCGTYEYKKKRITINISNCAGIAKSPRQWSWMGYKVNTTPQGVLAHEMGHHTDFAFGMVSHKMPVELLKKKVSGYEPNREEAFAETMKLFIINPDFLKQALPLRYKFLVDYLGLIPTEMGSYQEVLSYYNAPDRFFAAAANLIKSK